MKTTITGETKKLVENFSLILDKEISIQQENSKDFELEDIKNDDNYFQMRTFKVENIKFIVVIYFNKNNSIGRLRIDAPYKYFQVFELLGILNDFVVDLS